MEYRHTTLELRYVLFEGAPPVENPDIDAHMQEWVDADYELVNVTERSRDGGRYIEDTFTFFWRRST